MSASGDRSQFIILGLMGLAACAGGATAVHKGGETPTAPARAMVVPPPDATTPVGAKVESSVITVDADTPMTTPSGATTIVPKGWTATTEGKVVLLQDPNREVSLRLVERKEVDGIAALTAAWKQVEPAFARTLIVGTSRPGRDGWDASAHAVYETAVAEERWVWADGRRKGDTWFVTLSSGTIPGWGRRGSQADIVRSSYRAPGVIEESFAGRLAHGLDAERLSQLETFVEQGRQASQIPGVAVAVVQGGLAEGNPSMQGKQQQLVEMETLRGFPYLPAFRLCRAKPGFAIATRLQKRQWTVDGTMCIIGTGEFRTFHAPARGC